ncbi:cysteine--tRNA ligase [Bdellovibrio svalbardensis]|uniref:Cysteine--tRNA ligase n=1 Tax=Bdellovibrio svalbardensis TaxID=2972972 RepID=A0ABT6DH92_9BACT|nr:cysteine--tRNA ligase [Bdellovibrio svalbardensis]MDG0816224.1 cysteine--tRNA ligase [Bdellovibrio svalbardensis]
MALKIHNSQSKQLEEFVPLDPKHVKMYVCGPTVYNYLHVGNFRGVVVFNLVRNWLEYLGYKVSYALNFTDVDDKIINRAHEMNMEPGALAEQYIAEYKKDFASLGLRPHDFNPKVTESMDEITEMVQTLVKNGKAYETQGDVLYSIESFKDYGKLSGRQTDELQAGARVDVDEKKRNPLDFALWKAAKPGEISWPSPWGPGRPGWHIECSAMIQKIYGDQIDIHGGGMDLIFPHHENEIAQSEGCTGKHFVKYWMHNNMLNFGGQKMSKSLGNIVTMREFLETNSAELYKWMILSVHYRTMSDFSDAAIDRAVSGLARVYSAMSLAESYLTGEVKMADQAFQKITDDAWVKIEAALNDDFGTPEAFATLFEVVRQFNSQVRRGMKTNPAIQGKAVAFINFVHKFGALMSMFQEPAHDFLIKLDDLLLKKMNIERNLVDSIVNERTQARLTKDFAKSDELRKKLNDMGIAVSDTTEGSFWEVAK